MWLALRGERETKKKKKSWGLGFGALFILAAQRLLVDLNLIHQRCQSVGFTGVVNVQGMVVESCSGRRGSLKHLKAALLAAQETHSVSVGALFVFVCAVRRARRPLGKISQRFYFGGSGKKPPSWTNHPNPPYPPPPPPPPHPLLRPRT